MCSRAPCSPRQWGGVQWSADWAPRHSVLSTSPMTPGWAHWISSLGLTLGDLGSPSVVSIQSQLQKQEWE